MLEGQLESCQLAPRVVEHSERFAAGRRPIQKASRARVAPAQTAALAQPLATCPG